MEKLSTKITHYLTVGTDLEVEVVRYGVDALLSTVLCFSVALAVCALLGNLIFGCLFILFLTPVKMQFLGYHCKTMIRCITTYSICVGSSLLIYNYCLQFLTKLNLLVYFLILGILVKLVFTELTYHKSFILLLYVLVGVIFYFISPEYYLILTLVLLFEVFLILLKHK